MGSAGLAQVLEAWDLSSGLHEPQPGASADELEQAQRVLGRPLPASVQELYRAVGGGGFLEGNLGIYPLLGDTDEDLALTTASGALRSWEWPVPDELVVFGGNGTGDQFGLWLPQDAGDARPVVVELGEVFEERCLAVVGDDLPSFLAGWSAYYLASYEKAEALAALGVPEELRSLRDNGTDDEFFARLQWANPGLPDPRPDPYERGMTAGEVDAFARSPR